MITSLVIKNFKGLGEKEEYSFSSFDLLVGRNNSGKSTILQALAIWQFCIDEFRRNKKSDRTKKGGIQIVLPNFTPLPVPEFILLWHKQTERRIIKKEGGGTKPELILIEIAVKWLTETNEEKEYAVSIRYSSKQSVYAIPKDGWEAFNRLETENAFPVILYVPPFSGLDDNEERRDLTVIRKYVGKFQAGSVLRNILLRVFSEAGNSDDRTEKDKENWEQIHARIQTLFSVRLMDPVYKPDTDTLITCEYIHNGDNKKYDLISGGTGFHQTLILLSFIYGFHPDVILFDEPDAHLHTNLQREVLDYFRALSERRGIQFIIATHAEEFINGVTATQIISLLKGKPERIEATPNIITALSEISNLEITRTKSSPFILYVEGENDERILRAWATTLGKTEVIGKYFIKQMGGGSKIEMKDYAQKHFTGLSEIVPGVRRIVLFDYDSEESFHPDSDNQVLFEWSRKNIENYFFVPNAWRRAILSKLNEQTESLSNNHFMELVDSFFIKQRLTLGSKENWRTIDADVFKVLDGKKLLFANPNSLFQKLRAQDPRLILNRETIALLMDEEELHSDIISFFEKLETAVTDD